MALKRWAVRQISGLLSDYLEGITEQNLQASLSLEVGEVEIRHVRIHSELLRELRLCLLSSDVSVSARIPWRNLGSEPTVITVRDVWIEVEAEAAPASSLKADLSEASEELQRWRARRRRKVEVQIERVLADPEDETQPRRGMAARFGHAALRQLQVQVDGLRARVHPKVPTYPVMDLSVLRLALHEGYASPERLNEVPKEVQRHPASLDKILELVGLCAQLSSPNATADGEASWPALRKALEETQHCLERDAESVSLAGKLAGVKETLLQTHGSSTALIGPLSLDARLWHSRTGGILWLQTELQVSPTAAGICISPSNVRCISDAVNWYSEGLLPPGRRVARDEEKVQPPSGPEYAEMCVRRAKGEQMEDDQMRLDEIEDMAPIEWLARWQLKGLEQVGTENLRARPQPEPRGFARWMRPWRSEAPAESSSTTGDDDEMIDDIVEEAGEQSFFEEVEEPRRLEVRVLIPNCKILSCSRESDESQVLRIEGGVDCKLALATARAGAMADFLRAAWDADVSANLSSIAVILGEEPLMLLRHAPSTEEPNTLAATQTSRDDDDEFFDVQSDIEDEDFTSLTLTRGKEEAAAVSLLLHCSRFGGCAVNANSSVVPWSFRVRLKQEPFRFLLAPTSTHDALTTVLSVARAVTLTRADPALLPDVADTQSPSATTSPKAADSGPDVQALMLDLDLDVAAPVFRWGLLSDGHVTVALGRFVFRTSSQRPPQHLAPAERCDWMKFSCFCQLTETCVTAQGEDGTECRVYEPTTMSLQAWRDAENAQHWRWSLESQAFRWNIGPLFMKVVGQLPASLDYAMSPLRDVLSDAAATAVTAAPVAPTAAGGHCGAAAQVEGAESAKPRVQVKVSIMNFELVLCPTSDQKVSLALENISAQYAGFEGRSEMQGKVGACHLCSEEIALISFTRGASLQVSNSDRHVLVTAGSTLIAVQWYEVQIRKVVAAVDEAWEALAAGHEQAQGLLPVGDNAGMFAQLWSRYVINPIQVRVKQRAARRLEELLPGHSLQETVLDELLEEEDPQPRGQCSVEVNLSGEGLTVVFPESVAGTARHVLQVCVSGAECGFRAFQSGDAAAAVSLMAVNLELDGRMLLMPRRGDKLLKVDILRRAHVQPALIWSASWAQVCILFRQRDYDKLVAFLSSSIREAMPSRRRPEATQADEAHEKMLDTAEDEMKEQSRHGARFRLDVGAPLVFLPTDGRCLLQPRPTCADGYEGGQLEVNESGEPTFRPLSDDGFLMLDFGHVAASGGGADETGIKLQLRGAQVLGMEPVKDTETVEGRHSSELLWPVSLQAVLETPADGPVEFHAVSMEADGEGVVDHHMSLTRGQLSLLLDVLAENICYAGRSGSVAGGVVPVQRQVSQGGNTKNKIRGFRFSWRWPGELKWDIAFTQAAPLACLKLRGGMLGFSSLPGGSNYQLNCQSLIAIDTRGRSRNLVKTLLESAGSTDDLGFTVEVNVPMDRDTLAVIQLQKPTMHVLPQLVMDLVTVGLSSWQHCTFRNDRVMLAPQAPATRENEQKVVDKRGTRVQVNFLDGCFRIAEKWSEPTEHFEFAGSVMIHIMVHAEGIRIERFDLESGALRLFSSRRNPTTLCPCLEWLVRGDQKRIDDGARMKRHTTYEFRSVIVPPYSIRMSARDHRAMANAFLELFSMDAESSEPASETRSRDPLALQLVENRMTLIAEVALQGAEVQVMGEEGGNEWPGLCGNARCQLLQVMVDSRQGSAPTINIFGRELEVDISSRNHRLGVWEPVLSRCGLRFSYHMQRKPDGGPRDVFVRGDVSAIKPVQLVVSAPFVHLASRVFNDSSEKTRYGHLLAGINISGIACHVSVEDSAEGLVLPSSAKAESLDSLLKGRGRASTGSVPCLVLRLLDCPDAEPCRIPYGREADVTWDTKKEGFLMCRLVMPRPPQLVLVITSTVCVWNRTPADLEIRFLALGATDSSRQDLEPVKTSTSAQLSIDARLLSEGVSGETRVEASTLDDAGQLGRDEVSAGTLLLGAGQLLSAPTGAQLRMGQAVLQLRPALTDGGVTYTWSESFFAVPVASPNDTTVCASPPPEMQDLPKNWLYLRTSCGGDPQQGWSNVEVHAPFTVVNACPCDILCQFNPPGVQRRKLGKERERLPVEPGASIDMVVDNGFGDEVAVPTNGQAEVMPIRLDEEGFFRWVCNGRAGRTKPRWTSLSSVIVVLNRQRAEVEWHCVQASMSSNNHGTPQLRIAPQSMLPSFEFVAEDLTVSFAVRDLQGHASSWSLPLRAVLPTGARTEPVQLEFKGMFINLNAMRSGRELVVYTRWWFVNSTGLDVRLLQPGGPGPMHPVASFNSKVSILPEIQNGAGDGVAFVGLRSHAPVEVMVPDVGGSVAVGLTPLHPCCLRTETVALPEAIRGVPSCLVSLVPAMMLFNRTDHAEVGFRQQGCPSDTAVLVPPNSSRPLWWNSATDQRMQVAVRNLSDSTPTKRSWCTPFELQESRIGAYPVILKCGTSRELLCVCIDYEAASLAVTVRDSSHCHMLANKHPDVRLSASMEGAGEDPAYSFQVAYGEQVPFAGRGPPPGHVPRLRLTVQHAADAAQQATVMVDLHRSGAHRVPLWSGGPGVGTSHASSKRKSTLRVSAAVSVVLRNRVAVVTVAPVLKAARAASQPVQRQDEAGGDDGENEDAANLRTFNGELRIDQLFVGLVIEGSSRSLATSSVWGTAAELASTEPRQRREAFTIALAQVVMNVAQTPNRCRDVQFQIWDIQVDMQSPKRDVILKSTSQPALRTHTKRDDVRMLDVHLREVQLELGHLEVSVTGALMDQARLLRRNLTVGMGGLTFEQVLARAKGGIHLSNPQPPSASSKLVVNKLVVGDAKVDVWCQLHIPDAHYLPKSLRDTIQVFSLGATRLDIKGAQVRLSHQALFKSRPAEGNTSIVFSKVWDHYLPLVKNCWRSLLQHSNIFLGGFLSRHTWNPRQRRDWPNADPLCQIGSHGELQLRTPE